ncbi:MAG: hypothetical protein QXW70_01330 [Candidatus Anstonellales archaeon]
MDWAINIKSKKEELKMANFGHKVGYILSFIFFSLILFLLLSFTNKLPKEVSYPHILFLVFLLVLISNLLKRLFI